MNDRAATFRDSDGRVVGTTWGGTLCWYPRKPSALACVSRDGEREHVIRCGWCPGCLELDRRRLADRLVEWAKKVEGKIWLVIIESPLSKQSTLMAHMRRTASFASSIGFYRLTENACSILLVGKRPSFSSSASCRSIVVRLHAIKKSRGRRAWNLLTSGILKARDVWGKWTNRFYHRGLPKLAGEGWAVETRGGLRKRHCGAGQGARGVSGDVFLFPPLAWLPPRLARRKGPIEMRTREPERVASTLHFLTSRLRISESRSDDAREEVPSGRLSPPGRSAPPDASRASYLPKSGSLILNETRYQGSRQSDRAEIDAWLARMKQIAEAKAKGQGDPDG